MLSSKATPKPAVGRRERRVGQPYTSTSPAPTRLSAEAPWPSPKPQDPNSHEQIGPTNNKLHFATNHFQQGEHSQAKKPFFYQAFPRLRPKIAIFCPPPLFFFASFLIQAAGRGIAACFSPTQDTSIKCVNQSQLAPRSGHRPSGALAPSSCPRGAPPSLSAPASPKGPGRHHHFAAYLPYPKDAPPA